jgi:hypothetical protein
LLLLLLLRLQGLATCPRAAVVGTAVGSVGDVYCRRLFGKQLANEGDKKGVSDVDVTFLCVPIKVQEMSQQQQQHLDSQLQMLEQQLGQSASKNDVSRLEKKVDALHEGLSAVLKLLTQRAHPDSSSAVAAEGPHKRARAEPAAPTALAPLDDNEIFGSVLSYVGLGEYFYVAGVCRRWRGCYISFCHANARANDTYKLRSLREAVVSTAARLQRALHNGATLAVLDAEAVRSTGASLAHTIASRSLEPIAVLSLLRVYGYQWDSDLYVAAAEQGNLHLIKWLHQVQCPIAKVGDIALNCCKCMSSTAVSILQWLHALQPEWFDEEHDGDSANKTWLLYVAGGYGNLALMQWLRCELKTNWPDLDDIIYSDDSACTIVPEWNVKAVIWALEHGLKFEFDCSKLDPEKQTEKLFRDEAAVLWRWLHKERNRHRCTCSNA